MQNYYCKFVFCFFLFFFSELFSSFFFFGRKIVPAQLRSGLAVSRYSHFDQSKLEKFL